MKRKQGNITIEAAIAFTIVLIFVASIIAIMNVYRTDIILQESVEQCCEEYSIITPLSTTASDAVSTMLNALPDFSNEQNACVSQNIEVLGGAIGLDLFTGGAIQDLFLNGILSSSMEQRILSIYVERNGSEFFIPEVLDVDLRTNKSLNVIEVEVTYVLSTLVGEFERRIYSVVPIYGEFELFLYEEPEVSEESVWEQHNFDRGDYFRDMYGANLPDNFPVINSFEHGQALSITSIDLTNNSYIGNNENISSRVTEEIQDLASFNGGTLHSQGSTYTITNNSIQTRELIVVIPTNSNQNDIDTIVGLQDYASQQGVSLRIEQYGES